MKIPDDIHNYYEKLVSIYLAEIEISDRYDNEFIADLICLVLNQLPTRYIRHEVDMAFYLTEQERLTMVTDVETAVTSSLDFTICFVNVVCASTNANNGLRTFSSVIKLLTKNFLEF